MGIKNLPAPHAKIHELKIRIKYMSLLPLKRVKDNMILRAEYNKTPLKL